MLMLKWVVKGLKHVWSNTDQTIDASRWASVVGMPASNTFDTRLSKRTKHRPSNTEQKKCCKFLIEWLMANFIRHDQTRSPTIKQHQTRCPNGKTFGYQTMFDGVWSPNISRLSRPLRHYQVKQWKKYNVWYEYIKYETIHKIFACPRGRIPKVRNAIRKRKNEKWKCHVNSLARNAFKANVKYYFFSTGLTISKCLKKRNWKLLFIHLG